MSVGAGVGVAGREGCFEQEEREEEEEKKRRGSARVQGRVWQRKTGKRRRRGVGVVFPLIRNTSVLPVLFRLFRVIGGC